MKKEVFVERAVAVHGDKFDYSLVPDEVNWKDKVPVLCETHGQFLINAGNHISNGRGCAKCGFEHVSSIKTRRSKEEFFSLAPEVHNNKYDYSKVVFETKSTKVSIICPKHGEFKQSPDSHLKGLGCFKCGREVSGKKQSDTTEDFIKKAITVHGDEYDYSKVDYINQTSKVVIICKKHGEFYQQPNNHLSGKNGCPKCLPDRLSKINREDASDIKSKILQVCETRGYSLSKFEYKNSNSLCEIICHKHGMFKQRVRSILKGYGCVQCGVEKSANLRSKSIQDYLPKFLELFKGKYDYTNSIIVNSKTKFEVLCKEHGYFKTTVSNHIRGKGCPECGDHLCGYKVSKAGTFYILKVGESVLKFGISNKFDDRVRTIRNKSVFNIDVLYAFHFQDGRIAREIEERILFSEIERSVVNKADMLSGYTETCYIADLPKILNIVSEYKDQLS